MWQRVNPEGSVADRIIGQVEMLISDESLKPGDRLPSEREMAQLLGVSRPSLREAVRILTARGRLEVRRGLGVFVQAPRSERELRQALASTEMTVNELFAMREVLAVPAAQWAAERISDDQLRLLRTTLDEMSGLLDAGENIEFDRLRQLDTEFHMTIAAAAGNRFLRQTSSVLHEILQSGMETTLTIPGRVEVSRRDHERIYAALAAHDAVSARRAARAHIRGAHQAAMRRVEQAKRL
jgi:GntR family transcriptional repressor for pyruvate dehydrogenase complex